MDRKSPRLVGFLSQFDYRNAAFVSIFGHGGTFTYTINHHIYANVVI